MDHVLEYMKKHDVPMTRDKYLEYAYFGNPPAELSAEEESLLPEQFQKKEDTNGLLSPSGDGLQAS